MSDAILSQQFDDSAPPGPGGVPGGDLRRLNDVPMELSVEIGRTHMTVGETLELRPGSIVTLERLAGEPVDLLVNGTPIARGEVVVVEEQFGLRVTEILEDNADAEPPPGAPGGEQAGTPDAPGLTPADAPSGGPGPEEHPAQDFPHVDSQTSPSDE
jgi:flagellar motor switch protein FliN/FliY